MSGIETETKITLKDELYSQYDWFYTSFLSQIQKAADEFFTELFTFKLVSASKNINLLFQGDDYFVTKIRINKEHDIFVRDSSDAIKIILDNVLGEKQKFNISKITGLEAKIISSFNDYIYNSISNNLIQPQNKTTKRKDFNTIHLTFFIRENNSDSGAKIILSIPQDMICPMATQPPQKELEISKYKNCKIKVNIKIGKTKFTIKDLRNLEKDDIIIFEESNLHKMKVVFNNFEKDFKTNPNINLIISDDNENTNNGGPNMDEASFPQNLWDDIQVEMGAEFEKVKITLGELKNIERGLVVDIGTVYNSKVSLKVENKTIAEGELVIINDRYGVRIDNVISDGKQNKVEQQELVNDENEDSDESEVQSDEDYSIDESDDSDTDSDEDFDYSDFELDNEDI